MQNEAKTVVVGEQLDKVVIESRKTDSLQMIRGRKFERL